MYLIKKCFLVGFLLVLLLFLNVQFYLLITQAEDLKIKENVVDLKGKISKLSLESRSPVVLNESDLFKIILNMDLPLNLNFEGFNNVTGTHNFIVPNIVHYIRFQQIRFTFVEYICLISVYTYHRPSLIIIHTDVIQNGGFKGICKIYIFLIFIKTTYFLGKYWNWIKNHTGLYNCIRLMESEPPTEIFGAN